MNLIDFLAIILVILFIIWGTKKGFLCSAFRLVSLLISLILAILLHPVVSDALMQSPLYDFVYESAASVTEAHTNEKLAENEDALSLLFPKSLQKEAEKEAVNIVSINVAEISMKLLAILIVYFLVRIIIFILEKTLKLVSLFPVIRTANRFLGAITGGVYGLLALYLLLLVLTFTSTLPAFYKPTKLVYESKYVATMYHQNILLEWIK